MGNQVKVGWVISPDVHPRELQARGLSAPVHVFTPAWEGTLAWNKGLCSYLEACLLVFSISHPSGGAVFTDTQP